MLTIRPKKSIKEWFLLIVFYLLVFQSPLEMIFPICKYIDEIFPFIGFAGVFYVAIRNGKLVMKKNTAGGVFLLSVFFCAGIFGNLIYQYQPIKAVLTDLYTNFKFFFSILSGYVLFSVCSSEKDRKMILSHAKVVATVLFVFLVLDLVFHIYPSPEKRYGIRVVQLFYYHCTYLAAAMVFLLAIFMMYYEEDNKIYMLFALAVLFFTLRGKAMAGAAVYVLIFYFIILKKKELRIYHLLLMAAAVFVIGRDLFAFYYIDVDSGQSARRELSLTAIKIMKDYFPIGTGFGTYGSAMAAESYSPVYFNYGLNYVYGMSPEEASFACDTFWPVIMGQSGALGTFAYVMAMGVVFLRIMKTRMVSVNAYGAGIFVFAYLMISSTSEAAFNNSISVPLAAIIGLIFSLERKYNVETSVAKLLG